MIRWIWQGTAGWRGACDTLAGAREAAERYLPDSGRIAVVLAVRAFTVNGRQLYGPPAARYEGRRTGSRVTWTPAPLPSRQPARGADW